MQSSQKRPFILSIASGKGGVGKTLTTVNMAMTARRMGLKTLILDGDFGLANVHIVLGLKARYNISDVIDEQIDLEDIVLEGPMGLRVIPSGSGLARLADMKLTQRLMILEKIEELAINYDCLFIDTGAGISDAVMHLNSIADAIVLVTTPEPHAYSDAYAFIKVMSETYGRRNINLLVNQVVSESQGYKVYQKLSEVSEQFLGSSFEFAGSVPRDAVMERSVMAQRAADEQIKHTLAGQAWNDITRRILEKLKDRSLDDRGFGDLLFPQTKARAIRAL